MEVDQISSFILPIVSGALLPLRALPSVMSGLSALEASIRRVPHICSVVLEAGGGLIVILTPPSSEASSSSSVGGSGAAEVHWDGRVLHPSWCVR